MIISSMQSDHNNYRVFVSSTFLLHAFDTIDHSILVTRLSSWFGLHGSLLVWLKSYYLSSHSFRVRCNNTFSSFYTCSCGVPQGSVLGPLLFTMYTTPSALSSFPQPSPLCRRHPAVFLILPAQLRLKHHPSAKCPSAYLFLDDCQYPNSQFPQDWILTHWTQKATWQDTQLLT